MKSIFLFLLPAFTSGSLLQAQCGVDAGFYLSLGSFAPGATVTTVNISGGATTYQWFLDGQYHSSTPTFSQQFNQAGSHRLYLIATNSQCSDTSATTFFNIGNCTAGATTVNWLFSHSMLTFATSPPTITWLNHLDGFQESTTVMSDYNGNLLFYSTGDTVYDRSHNPMPNGTGLMGGVSATQGQLIIPIPGSTGRYYLFTAPMQENSFTGGVRYNIIDMTLNNGLGDIEAGQKNILLDIEGGEKLTATYHANGHDIWLGICHTGGFNHYAYLITSAGISPTPVVSALGTTTGGEGGIGSMRFSHNGNKVAIAYSTLPFSIIVADFDKATGVMSNEIVISDPNLQNTVNYFLEFSPDDSKLYATYWGAPMVLYQYDLLAGNAAAVLASGTLISSEGTNYGTLRLGNDGKIYIPVMGFQGATLNYIENPNLPGTACGYHITTTPAYNLDLPNLFRANPPVSNVSLGNDTTICGNISIVLSSQQPYQNYLWNTGAQTPSITVNQPGAYWLMATEGGCSARDTIVISNGNLPAFELTYNGDTMACKESLPFTLNGPNGYNYQWQNGATTQGIPLTSVGTYYVVIDDGSGCTAVDSFTVYDCLGLDENAANNITIYPSPANEILFVESGVQGLQHANILTAEGRLVASATFTGKTQLPISHLANGVYIVELINDKTIYRRKFLVIH